MTATEKLRQYNRMIAEETNVKRVICAPTANTDRGILELVYDRDTDKMILLLDGRPQEAPKSIEALSQSVLDGMSQASS